MSLLLVEIERSLRRRMVWALLAVALVGIVLMAVIAFVSSAGSEFTAMQAAGEPHPAIVSDWWSEDGGDSPILVAAIFLLLGGLIGGAGVVGGEWRAGSVATLLTWEPRRGRLLAARLGAVALCSLVLALALQIVLLAALLPAVVAHGSAAGVDGPFVASLLAAIGRVAVVTSVAAVIGACGAWISRNTAVAIVAIWAWIALGEAIVRVRRPGLSTYLLGENLMRFLLWDDLGDVSAHVGPAHAAVVLGVVAAAGVVAARTVFRAIGRDERMSTDGPG